MPDIEEDDAQRRAQIAVAIAELSALTGLPPVEALQKATSWARALRMREVEQKGNEP